MGRGPGRYFESDIIVEAYEVLVRGEKPSKAINERELQWQLGNPEIALRVLQLCLEHDIQNSLFDFKIGLMLIIKEHGVEAVAKKAKINRVSLYRMLSPKGNPEVKTLMRLLKVLDLKMWMVSDSQFTTKVRRLRAKDIFSPTLFRGSKRRNNKPME